VIYGGKSGFVGVLVTSENSDFGGDLLTCRGKGVLMLFW
jgi:hypothetical protein